MYMTINIKKLHVRTCTKFVEILHPNLFQLAQDILKTRYCCCPKWEIIFNHTAVSFIFLTFHELVILCASLNL